MIKNERQYKVTKQRVEEFTSAITALRNKEKLTEWDQVQLDALSGQLTDLESEVEEFDQLRSGVVAEMEINSFGELPSALVRARIASGLTQRELAQKLGLKEQQIQRYEQQDYAGARIERIKEVMEALGLKLNKRLLFPETVASLDGIYQRLQTIGINRDFINNRLLPARFSDQGDVHHRRSKADEEQTIAELTSRVSRIYGLSPQQICENIPLLLVPNEATAARFKLPKRTNERSVTAYTFYAHYLALLVLHATKGPMRFVNPDSATVRHQIEQLSGQVSYRSVLTFVWSLGIPVIPLKDPGMFHGACWRVNGRSVIVLKQSTFSEARWLIDLLHELYHAIQEPDTKSFAVVEAPEGAVIPSNQGDEEIDATEFAGDIVLNDRADDLAVLCQQEARGSGSTS